MAAVYTTRAYGSIGLSGRIASTLTMLAGKLVAWNDARVTRNALSDLTDRELEDIGLCRGDIDSVAAGRAF